MSHGHAGIGEATPQSSFYSQGRLGRLFPTLPPFASETKLIRDALVERGAPGRPMDAGDDLSDPITLITDPAKSVNNPDNPTLSAGFRPRLDTHLRPRRIVHHVDLLNTAGVVATL